MNYMFLVFFSNLRLKSSSFALSENCIFHTIFKMLEFDEVGTSTPQPSLKSRMASAASSDYYCMTFDEPEEMDDVTLSSSATSKARK